MFKRAVSTKDQETCARYKRVRNEITSEIRNAKARYFNAKLAEVKSASSLIFIFETLMETLFSIHAVFESYRFCLLVINVMPKMLKDCHFISIW